MRVWSATICVVPRPPYQLHSHTLILPLSLFPAHPTRAGLRRRPLADEVHARPGVRRGQVAVASACRQASGWCVGRASKDKISAVGRRPDLSQGQVTNSVRRWQFPQGEEITLRCFMRLMMMMMTTTTTMTITMLMIAAVLLSLVGWFALY